MKLISQILAMLTVLALLLSTAVAQTPQDELAELDKKIEEKKLEIQIAELQLQLSSINGDERQQITAQMNLAELEARISELESQRAQVIENLVNDLQAQIAELQAQNESMKTSIAANEVQIAFLEAEITKLASEVQAGSANVEFSSTQPGFVSYVTTTVQLQGATITAIAVNASGETKGLGTRAAEPAYLNQFIGMSIFDADKLDVCSGATFTSKAVLLGLTDIAYQAKLAGSAPKENAAENVVRILTGSGVGFMNGNVPVTVTVDGYGRITCVEVDLSTQIAPICDKVEDEDFLSQFIGKTGPFTVGENVDVVTGATYTSQAVIEAINEALGY